MIKKILKGLLFYGTILYALFYCMAIDSIFEHGLAVILMITSGLVGMVLLFCKYITEEEAEIFTFKKLFDKMMK